MPDTLIKVDLTQSAYDNDMIHNRWHPDVPIVAWVSPGDDFIVETYDWTGGFIKNNDSAGDVRDIDLSIVHFLSGPIGVKGAEPGDLASGLFTTANFPGASSNQLSAAQNLFAMLTGRVGTIGADARLDASGKYIYRVRDVKNFDVKQSLGESQWSAQATFKYEF